MNWLIFSISLLLIVLFVWRYHRRRLKLFDNIAEEGLASWIQLLYDSGYDGALMIIRDTGSDRFLQFRKYIRETGQMGIESHFPQAPWSRAYYDALIELLKRNGLSFGFVKGGPNEPTTEFVHLDFDSNVTAATAWAIDVFKIVFGCPQVRVTIRADRIHPRRERVDRKDYPTPVDQLFKNRQRCG